VFWKLNPSVAGGAVDSHPEQFRGCFQWLLTVWAVEPEIGHAILRLAEYLKKISGKSYFKTGAPSTRQLTQGQGGVKGCGVHSVFCRFCLNADS
jgi:hypothetical protein